MYNTVEDYFHEWTKAKREEVQATLDGITAQTGVPILNLPATRMFKIRVDFRMSDDD